MWRGGRVLVVLLCGVVLAMGAVWIWRQSRMEVLELRPGPQSGVEFSVLDRGKVNINLASQEELEKLPGIGPELARNIVAYREENGPFEYVEHLIYVPGIGRATVEALLEYIAV